MISKTLKEFEPLLLSQNFFRISRSCIVNTDYILKYKNKDGGINYRMYWGFEELLDTAPLKVTLQTSPGWCAFK